VRTQVLPSFEVLTYACINHILRQRERDRERERERTKEVERDKEREREIQEVAKYVCVCEYAYLHAFV